MARKPDTPCQGCGKLLYSGTTSAPADKRLCLACRRAGRTADEPVEPPPHAEPSDGFGPRGTRLWRDTTAVPGLKMSPAEVVLLEEACRLADRLDRLDDFLSGRGDVWLRFHARNEDGSIVRVVIDRALTEARQQADTLQSIVADLVRRQPGQQPAEPAKESILDELARRRSERQQAASGT